MITSMTKFFSLLLSFTFVVQVNAGCRSNKVNYGWRPAQIPVARIPQPKIPTIPSFPEISPEKGPQNEVVNVELGVIRERKKRGFFVKTFNSPEKKYALVGGIVGLATMAAIVISSLRNRSDITFVEDNSEVDPKPWTVLGGSFRYG